MHMPPPLKMTSGRPQGLPRSHVQMEVAHGQVDSGLGSWHIFTSKTSFEGKRIENVSLKEREREELVACATYLPSSVQSGKRNWVN